MWSEICQVYCEVLFLSSAYVFEQTLPLDVVAYLIKPSSSVDNRSRQKQNTKRRRGRQKPKQHSISVLVKQKEKSLKLSSLQTTISFSIVYS